MSRIFPLCVGPLAVCVGCERQPSSLVLATVNGVPLTREEVRVSVEVRAKMAELRGTPIKKSDYEEWANEFGLQMFWPLVHSKLILQEFDREHLAVEKKDQELVLSTYNRETGKSASSLEELSSLFGDRADDFRRQAEQSAKITAYQRTHWAVDITEEKIDAFYVSKSNELARANQIDRSAREKGKRAYGHLQKGESWTKVAQLFSEDRLVGKAQERYATSWLHVRADAMGMSELAAQLPTMKVGDYTRPFETRWGLLIVRLVEKKRDVYRIARMLFRMAKPVEIPSTREKAREELTRLLKNEKRVETLKRLREKAKLTFPLGTNFTFQVYETAQENAPSGKENERK